MIVGAKRLPICYNNNTKCSCVSCRCQNFDVYLLRHPMSSCGACIAFIIRRLCCSMHLLEKAVDGGDG